MSERPNARLKAAPQLRRIPLGRRAEAAIHSLALSLRGKSCRVACGVALLLGLQGEPLQQSWMFGPFEKPAQVNPVIMPNPISRFRSPMSDSLVAWEEFATFNPAAVAKDGKVFLLYRAEDASGERQIGRHTSRLGLAESTDGLRFTRRGTPVLYPDTDAQRQYEWPDRKSVV